MNSLNNSDREAVVIKCQNGWVVSVDGILERFFTTRDAASRYADLRVIGYKPAEIKSA